MDQAGETLGKRTNSDIGRALSRLRYFGEGEPVTAEACRGEGQRVFHERAPSASGVPYYETTAATRCGFGNEKALSTVNRRRETKTPELFGCWCATRDCLRPRRFEVEGRSRLVPGQRRTTNWRRASEGRARRRVSACLSGRSASRSGGMGWMGATFGGPAGLRASPKARAGAGRGGGTHSDIGRARGRSETLLLWLQIQVTSQRLQ